MDNGNIVQKKTDKPKLIGVCLSQAHNFPNTGFLNALNSAAAAGGYAVAVFNSSMDFSWQQKDNIAARAIYKTIRYELFSALLIIYHSMHDDELVSGLVQGAQEHGVPVICAGAELPGCWSIVGYLFHRGFEERTEFRIPLPVLPGGP